MAQQPHGRHTEGAVRERRINTEARMSQRTGGHPGHAAAYAADSPYPDSDRRYEGQARTGGAPSSANGSGKHARYVPGVGDVIERTPRVGQSSVAARQQVRAIADPDETVRIPRTVAGQRVVVDSEEPVAAEPGQLRRDSFFGRHLFLFSLLIIGACWCACVALAGAGVASMTCDVSGTVRLLFLALRDAGTSLFSEADALAAPAAVALAVCAVSFAYALKQMRRARMPWQILIPCLAFYCLFPLWGGVSDFGAVLTSALVVLIAVSATKVLAGGRPIGSWVALGATCLAVCLSSDIGTSIALVAAVIVFLWLLARCGQSRKAPEQLVRADGTTWRARTNDNERRRIHEQARARRLPPQQAVKRALVVVAVAAFAYVALPDVLVPITGAPVLFVENDVRALLALAPQVVCCIAGGVMLYRGE